MSPTEFAYISEFLKRRSGLVLTPDKEYLIESRLRPLLRSRGLKDFKELTEALRGHDETLKRLVTEAMTTNETSFFRDMKPFQLFREFVLPRMIASRESVRRLRIWSAACSTGQEPYTLVMLLNEERARLNGWSWEILATDISTDALAKAQAGVYSQFEAQRGLPGPMLMKYFNKVGDNWQIKSEWRSTIQFRSLNLLDDLRHLGQFDIVFCRNVLIYFDPPTKGAVLDKMSRLLAPDGFLFLGGAETVMGISNRFEPVAGQRGLYGPAGCNAAAATPGSSATSSLKPGLKPRPTASTLSQSYRA